MSSLVTETTILTVPNQYSLGPNPDEIDIREGTFVDLTVTGTFNGSPISGTLLTTTNAVDVQNKSFFDTNNQFVDAVDTTKQLRFDVDVTAGTTTTIAIASTANRTVTLQEPGTDCDFVTTSGAQQIGGEKVFTEALNLTQYTGLGVTVNAYRKQRITPTITIDSAAITVFTHTPDVTINMASYMFIANIATFDKDNTTFANFKLSAAVQINTGTLSLISVYDGWDVLGSSWPSNPAIDWTVSAGNVLLQVFGIPGNSVYWDGTVEIISCIDR